MAKTFHVNSEQETADLAVWIGALLRSGDCLLLEGPVGAGKSFFARALIQSVQDVPEDVPSPTFTLVQTYDTRIGEVWHADLYRLSSVDELVELGLEDAFHAAVTLVEWPERLGAARPARYLTVAIDLIGEASRDITLTPVGNLPWMADL